MPGAPTRIPGKSVPSSRTTAARRCSMVCMLCEILRIMQAMPTTAILGASGYAGQETLDRVLAHPELELVALGSDSLAGSSASALDVRLNGSLPACVPNAEAAASGADVLFLCLGNERAAAFEPPADAVVVDLSGAHRLEAALYP